MIIRGCYGERQQLQYTSPTISCKPTVCSTSYTTCLFVCMLVCYCERQELQDIYLLQFLRESTVFSIYYTCLRYDSVNASCSIHISPKLLCVKLEYVCSATYTTCLIVRRYVMVNASRSIQLRYSMKLVCMCVLLHANKRQSELQHTLQLTRHSFAPLASSLMHNSAKHT